MKQPTRREIAKILGISAPRVQQLVNEGVLPATGSIDDYVSANEARVGDTHKQLDLTAERARLAKAQADAKEMENEVSRGELIRRDVVVEQWRGEFARAKSKLLAMPAKLAPLMVGVKTPAEAQSMIETVVWEALNELSKAD